MKWMIWSWRKLLSIAGVISILVHGDVLAESLSLDRLAGVYKFPVTSLFADGEKLNSEDILEIVKVSDSTAYFRSDLLFGNGHTCRIWGIADVADDALVFFQPKNLLGESCLFKLELSDNRIALDDEGQRCARVTCGARGLYDGISFELKKRRPIKYMERLLKSEQYQQAVQDREEGKTGVRLKSATAP